MNKLCPIYYMLSRDTHQKKWLCEKCAHWHYNAKARGPSGNSSGGDRDSQYPRKDFKPFIRPVTVRHMLYIHSLGSEIQMPAQEQKEEIRSEPKAEEKSLPKKLSKPEPKTQTVTRELELF